jgi:hypothetical protein
VCSRLSAYRTTLKSLGRRYLLLHDEIGDLDAMTDAMWMDWRPLWWHATRSA